jgi:hypothetical protein
MRFLFLSPATFDDTIPPKPRHKSCSHLVSLFFHLHISAFPLPCMPANAILIFLLISSLGFGDDLYVSCQQFLTTTHVSALRFRTVRFRAKLPLILDGCRNTGEMCCCRSIAGNGEGIRWRYRLYFQINLRGYRRCRWPRGEMLMGWGLSLSLIVRMLLDYV